MIEFSELHALRARLLDSLVLWGQRSGDGLYRSMPLKGVSPSYTNSGIALQALVEGGRLYPAQRLADRLLETLTDIRADVSGPGVFPHEKAGPEREGHVMSNAWPVFALLETYPVRRDAAGPIVSWLVKTQGPNGGWSLLPGEESRPPIITAYALMVLLKYWECWMGASSSGEATNAEMVSLEKSIEDGVAYLESCCLARQKESGLLLWTSWGDLGGGSPASVGTSAMCIHVLAKWERLKGQSELTQKGMNTFLQLSSAIDNLDSLRVGLNGDQLAMWDQLALNEGRLNYLWSFFAPISGVTILRFAEFLGTSERRPLLVFAEGLAKWVQANEKRVDKHSVGISGGATISDAKTWSTALSVVFLSRVLSGRHLFDSQQSGVSITSTKGDGLEQFLLPPSPKTLRVARLGGGFIIGLILWRWVLPLVQPDRWAEQEGLIWLVTVCLSMLGVNMTGLGMVSDSATRWIVRISRLRALCREGEGR